MSNFIKIGNLDINMNYVSMIQRDEIYPKLIMYFHNETQGKTEVCFVNRRDEYKKACSILDDYLSGKKQTVFLALSETAECKSKNS